jgi:MOSC domain-containing protein YiiM
MLSVVIKNAVFNSPLGELARNFSISGIGTHKLAEPIGSVHRSGSAFVTGAFVRHTCLSR